jgi:hypothetical protein
MWTHIIAKNLVRLRCLRNGQRIRKDLNSNDPKVKQEAERTVSIIVGIVIVLLSIYLWPYLLAAAIIYYLYKIFQ